jgi:hypothetical protein
MILFCDSLLSNTPKRGEIFGKVYEEKYLYTQKLVHKCSLLLVMGFLKVGKELTQLLSQQYCKMQQHYNKPSPAS